MYHPDPTRYANMIYNRCGCSGLKLPAVSLGLWHNFGGVDSLDEARRILCRAFDLGITHFDLANNYGPPPGSAEANLGKVLHRDLRPHRDELVISTKAGYLMWEGPYGDWGSRKYLLASLDQSLARMGLDYVDIFYSHRPDPQTPLAETMSALASAVHNGKALYVGISNYPAERTREAAQLLQQMGVPCLIHQPRYSLLDRWVENGLLEVLEECGVGCISYSPLAQGVLSNRYLKGIPERSRAAKPHGFLKREELSPQLIERLNQLQRLAQDRDQSLAQMALAWILKDARITSVLVGVSSVAQLEDNLRCLGNTSFSSDELAKIDAILTKASPPRI